MISEAAVRDLAARSGDPAVATIYLHVDGRHRRSGRTPTTSVEFCRGGELDRFGRIGALERY